MNRWYSARGARRGLRLAAAAMALWVAWAIGYVQSSREPAAAAPVHAITVDAFERGRT